MKIASTKMRVACIIPTRNGDVEVERLLKSLGRQDYPVTVLVVDSASTDKTQEVLARYGVSMIQIDVKNFNHGGTRQMMAEQHADFDIYVYLTQDAYLERCDAISRLISFFCDSRDGAVCGR